MMWICAYAVYLVLYSIHPGNMVTLISILVAVLVYTLAIIALKVFTKEEILMIPYGQKICRVLEKIGVYKNE